MVHRRATNAAAAVNDDDFRDWSRRAAEWGADYRRLLRERPVAPNLAPGDIARRIASSPPEAPEPIEAIFHDFETIIVPGMTHWQHPRFFAFFPGNAAPVSVVAEYLVSAIAAQCMLWRTSPAATELETCVLDWLRQGLGLPEGFSGVIQDSASSATLVAVLVMRERALAWAGNRAGLAGQPKIRIYGSNEVHSSIDRAIWVSGIGDDNLVRIPVAGRMRSMDLAALEAAIVRDRDAGFLPAGIIATVGGTSVGAVDNVAGEAASAKRFDLFLHVDAAWAGSAMICPEFRDLWKGIENVDSLVLNPHKWLGAQFDCSAHFVRDPDALVKTLAIKPEYLKSARGAEEVHNYSEWSIPLGRRFRALKLWFLLRAYGLEGLREMIRNHVSWSLALAARLAATPGFEIVTAPMLSLFSFRIVGAGDPDSANRDLVARINEDGRLFLTQTNVDGKTVVRFQVGSFASTEADVEMAYDVIVEMARR